MARVSGKNVSVWTAVIVLSACLAFVLPKLADKSAQWAITKVLAEGFDVTVSIEQMKVEWWPLAIELQGVDVAHPRVHPVRLSHIRADVDFKSLFEGVLVVPLMHIEGVKIGRRSVVANSASLGGEPSGGAFVFPDARPLPLQALVDAERRRYDEQVRAFRDELQRKQNSWAQQLQQLPDDAALAAHRERFDRRRELLGSVAADDPVLLLEADLARFAQVDDALRSDWQRFQNHYLDLKMLAQRSVERIIEERGLSEAQLAALGQRLVQDTLHDWFERGLGFHQVLAGHEGGAEHAGGEPPALSVLVRKVVFGGVFEHGARRGQISGELLNLSNAPVRLTEPLTLHIEAHGKGLGDLQLSALLDHRTPGREADRFNFSLQKTRFPRFVLADNQALTIGMRKALLSVDMAGTIGQKGTLDLSLSSVFNTQSIDVKVKSADNPLANALAKALLPLGHVMLAGAVKGTLERPEMHANTTLDDVIAPVARDLVESVLASERAQLLEQLKLELQLRLAGLEKDLAHSSALLDVAKQRAEPFDRLRNTLTP